MEVDRWEQRSGLWVRRRDDGDWDYFPSLREPVSGYRVKAAMFDRLEQSEFVGKALAFGLGAPIMFCALLFFAMRSGWGFLDHTGRGYFFLFGLLIVAGASAARWFARRRALARAAVSDTVLSVDELRDLTEHIQQTDAQGAARPGLSSGLRTALILLIGAMAVLAVAVFLMAFALGLETTMLVSGILTLLCGLVALRLWHLSRGIV